jgi:hypothetical protein
MRKIMLDADVGLNRPTWDKTRLVIMDQDINQFQ